MTDTQTTNPIDDSTDGTDSTSATDNSAHLRISERADLPVLTLSKRQLTALAEEVASLMTGDGWMSSDQVCEWLQIRRDYLYDLVSADKIPHVKLGRLLRFRRSELEKWIEEFRR